MLNYDPKKTMYRVIFMLAGLSFIGLGVGSIQHGNVTYYNSWGGLVFAPFAILVGVGFILAAIFKPSIFRG
jgi:hypothetical protein